MFQTSLENVVSVTDEIVKAVEDKLANEGVPRSRRQYVKTKLEPLAILILPMSKAWLLSLVALDVADVGNLAIFYEDPKVFKNAFEYETLSFIAALRDNATMRLGAPELNKTERTIVQIRGWSGYFELKRKVDTYFFWDVHALLQERVVEFVSA